MKRWAPLIGANKWSDIHSTTQGLIVSDVLVSTIFFIALFSSPTNIQILLIVTSCNSFWEKWALEDNEDTREKS